MKKILYTQPSELVSCFICKCIFETNEHHMPTVSNGSELKVDCPNCGKPCQEYVNSDTAYLATQTYEENLENFKKFR